MSSQTTKLHLISRVCQKFEGLSCLVKPNYKTTPYFVRVSKFQAVLSCQAKLQNYTRFRVYVQNFKDCLVLSSQTTKLHLILRGSPNFKSLVLSSQTTKLHLILHVCQKFQGLACLVKPNYKTTPYFERVPNCLLYTSPSPRDRTRSRMPSSA